MLERELLGSSRSIIDAHSNRPLTHQTQPSTYRTSYTPTNQLPYTTTTSSYQYLGYGTTPPAENLETKKALNDVRNLRLDCTVSFVVLVTRSNSFIKKRCREER